MTGWASNAVRTLIGASALALVASAAFAQPRSIIPGQTTTPTPPAAGSTTTTAPSSPPGANNPSQPPSSSGSLGTMSVTPTTTWPSGMTVPPKPADPNAVQVGTLAPPDLTAGGGLLTAEQGGFGDQMWRGTDRYTAEKLLDALPAANRSTIGRALERRLLASVAQAPEGSGTSGVSLLDLRASKLMGLGDVKSAAELVKQSGDPAAADRFATEAALLAGTTDEACARVKRQLGNTQDQFWLKAWLYCQVAGNETSAAVVTLSLLRDQGLKDAAYETLASVLVGESKAKIEKLGRIGPLELAMLKLSKRPIPPDVLTTASPPVLAFLADSEGLTGEQKLIAAEQAESYGALPTAKLAQIYGAEQFSEQDKSQPSTALAKKSPRGAALLYQLANGASTPTLRAEYVKRALQYGRDRGLYATEARVLAGAMKGLNPTSDQAPSAAEIMRGLLALGDVQTAKTWVAALAGMRGEKAADEALADAWPSLLLAGVVDYDDRAIAAWSERQPEAQRARRVAWLADLAQGLGYPVGGRRWVDGIALPNVADEAIPAPNALVRLPRAAEAGAKAEVVALVVIAIGPEGGAKAGPVAIAPSIAVLGRIGLTAEARALAVESALLRGL